MTFLKKWSQECRGYLSHRCIIKSQVPVCCHVKQSSALLVVQKNRKRKIGVALFTLFALRNSSLGETETKFLQKASKITWGHHGKPNTSLSQA